MRPCKAKAVPVTGLERPKGFQEVEASRFQDNRHLKVVRLSALRTGRLYPHTWYSFLFGAESPQGHCAAGRIMSMENSSDTIGNRTRDLPTCSAVPQPNAPRCERVVEFIIPMFLNFSTCFERHTAHHQELKNCNCSLWFYSF